jgi:hypothetical protein
MPLETIVAGSVCLVVGVTIGVYVKTLANMDKLPQDIESNEKHFKEHRFDSARNFLEYYAGKPGRFLAYIKLQ